MLFREDVFVIVVATCLIEGGFRCVRGQVVLYEGPRVGLECEIVLLVTGLLEGSIPSKALT